MAKGSRGRTTGGARRQGGRAGRRQPSKPLIIDVEASDVAAPNSAPAASAPANSDTKPASSGLDEKAAIGAGLMADDAPRAAQASASASVAEPEAANASAPASSATEPASADKAESANDQDTAPAGLAAAAAAGSAKQAGGPSPFYLFAAGLVGGLLALALMFLAQMLGLIAPPNTGLDEQRAALQATEERLAARITALETAEAVSVDAPPAVDLGPLETQVASLGARLDEVSANLAAGDAADAAGVDPDAFRSLLAEATSALSGRVDALEAQIATVSAPESDAGLGDLQSVTAALSDQVAGAQSALSDLSERLAAVEAQGAPAVDSADAAPTAPAPETMARLDALDGLIASNGARLESAEGGVAGLTDTVAGLSSQLSSLTDDVAALGSSMQALADAPAAPAPDPIARLGVALDALTVARDAGQPVAPLVEAAKAAASFESTLSAAFEPLGSVTFPDQLDAGTLLSAYEAARPAMLAAAGSDEAGGLLGALGERARQMVSIQSPDGPVAGADTISGGIDQVGALLAAGRFADAEAALSALPDAVTGAAADLAGLLSARTALDAAIAAAQTGLVEVLANPTPAADPA